MIKINYLLPTARFSTLRVPTRYTAAFQLNHRIRSCLTLHDLTAFVLQHDQDIRAHAKTSILQYLNEFPLNFSATSIQNSPNVYDYILKLENLNLYEEQLRHSNLIKMMEHSGRNGSKIRNLVIEQENRLLQLAKKQEFDLVDAINWLVMRKNLRCNALVLHSLQVICRSDVNRYANMFTKLINLIIKKLDDLEWYNVRKYKVIFQFMCESYKEKRDNITKQISNCHKLASLQLHLLGYDSIPLPLRNILATVQQHASELDLRNLETALSLNALLPYNSLHPSEIKFLVNQILARGQRQIIYLQMLPLDRMNPCELEALAQLYTKKWFCLENTPYYVNKPYIQLLIYRPIFIQQVETDFFRAIQQTQKLLLTNICGCIASATKLLEYFKFNPQKKQAVKDQFASVYRRYAQVFGQKTIIQNNSLLNVLRLRHLEEECSMVLNKDQFQKEIIKALTWFAKKKQQSNLRFKIPASQIQEVVYHYRNTHIQSLLQLIISIITTDLQNTQDFSYSYGAWITFSLEGSVNHASFQPILGKLYSKFETQDLSGLAQYYILFPFKTQELTCKILNKLWRMDRCFSPLAKIIAHCDLFHLEREGHLFPQVIRIIEQCASVLEEQQVKQLSIGELSKLIAFCRCFYKEVPLLANKFPILALKCLSASALDPTTRDQEQRMRELWRQLNIMKSIFVNKNQALLLQMQTLDGHPKLQLSQKRWMKRLGVSFTSDNTNSVEVSQENLEKAFYEAYSQQIDGGSQKTNVLQFLLAYLQNKISLTIEGQLYLQQQLQQAVKRYQIYPSDIKKYFQILLFTNPTSVGQHRISNLIQILQFSQGENIVVQDTSFYIWCLQIADQYSSQSLLSSAFNRLSTRPLATDETTKILKILERYPHLIHQGLLDQMAQQITRDFPKYNQNYLPFLSYLRKAIGSLPQKYVTIADEIQKSIQLQKSHKNDRIQMRHSVDVFEKSKDGQNRSNGFFRARKILKLNQNERKQQKGTSQLQ